MKELPNVFIDELGTKFTKLPADDIYDYHLRDQHGEDKCTIGQIEKWEVQITEIIEE